MTAALFPVGQVTVTPGALRALQGTGASLLELLERHVRGDWGQVGAEDARENALSLEHGFRLLSSYRLASGERVWLITEADRSLTTLLLPEEY